MHLTLRRSNLRINQLKTNRPPNLLHQRPQSRAPPRLRLRLQNRPPSRNIIIMRRCLHGWRTLPPKPTAVVMMMGNVKAPSNSNGSRLLSSRATRCLEQAKFGRQTYIMMGREKGKPSGMLQMKHMTQTIQAFTFHSPILKRNIRNSGSNSDQPLGGRHGDFSDSQ